MSRMSIVSKKSKKSKVSGKSVTSSVSKTSDISIEKLDSESQTKKKAIKSRLSNSGINALPLQFGQSQNQILLEGSAQKVNFPIPNRMGAISSFARPVDSLFRRKATVNESDKSRDMSPDPDYSIIKLKKSPRPSMSGANVILPAGMDMSAFNRTHELEVLSEDSLSSGESNNAVMKQALQMNSKMKSVPRQSNMLFGSSNRRARYKMTNNRSNSRLKSLSRQNSRSSSVQKTFNSMNPDANYRGKSRLRKMNNPRGSTMSVISSVGKNTKQASKNDAGTGGKKFYYFEVDNPNQIIQRKLKFSGQNGQFKIVGHFNNLNSGPCIHPKKWNGKEVIKKKPVEKYTFTKVSSLKATQSNIGMTNYLSKIKSIKKVVPSSKSIKNPDDVDKRNSIEEFEDNLMNVVDNITNESAL